MNTRTGKIARLQDGQPAETILAWLNPRLNLPIREINREVSQLRLDDHRALQARIRHERWQQEQAEQQAAEQAQREKQLQLTKEAAFWAPMKVSILAESFGGGQAGRHVAAAAIETDSGFPRGTLTNLPENRLPEDNKTTPTTPTDLSRRPVTPKSDAGGPVAPAEVAPVAPTKTPENPSKSK